MLLLFVVKNLAVSIIVICFLLLRPDSYSWLWSWGHGELGPHHLQVAHLLTSHHCYCYTVLHAFLWRLFLRSILDVLWGLLQIFVFLGMLLANALSGLLWEFVLLALLREYVCHAHFVRSFAGIRVVRTVAGICLQDRCKDLSCPGCCRDMTFQDCWRDMTCTVPFWGTDGRNVALPSSTEPNYV